MAEKNRPDQEMLDIHFCKNCGQKEYYGMLTWINGHEVCRRCAYEEWSKHGDWGQSNDDFVFPQYSDGVDYTREQSV